MLLHEIIKANEEDKTPILCEILHKYKKSLYTYYKRYFCCEPVLMVTDVFNAAQYALIVPANEFMEAIEEYIEKSNPEDSEEDKEGYRETINFNSIMLSKF